MASIHRSQLRLQQLTGSLNSGQAAQANLNAPSMQLVLDHLASGINNISGQLFHDTADSELKDLNPGGSRSRISYVQGASTILKGPAGSSVVDVADALIQTAQPIDASGKIEILANADASSATDDSASLHSDGGASITKKLFAGQHVELASVGGTVKMGSATPAVVSAAGILNIDNTTDATNTTNGSLQTDGGLSVAKAIFNGQAATLASASGIVTMGSATAATVSAAGILNINNTTDATNATNGSLQTDGGLSVAKKIFNATDATLAASSGVVTMGSATAAVVDANGKLNINNTTDASSTTDGSLQTDGGLSVAKKAFIGTDLTVTGNTAANGNLTVAGDLTVNGATTTINSTTLTVDDKNVELASVANVTGISTVVNLGTGDANVVVSESDGAQILVGATLSKTGGAGSFNAGGARVASKSTGGGQTTLVIAQGNNAGAGAITFDVDNTTDFTADGAGLTIKGASDKTILYAQASGDFDFTENVDIASGKVYKINGNERLSDATLSLGGTAEQITKDGNAIKFKAAGADELKLDATHLFPVADGGLTLGKRDTNEWAGLEMNASSVIAFGNNDVSLTHSGGALTLSSTDKLQFDDSNVGIYKGPGSGTGSQLALRTGNVELRLPGLGGSFPPVGNMLMHQGGGELVFQDPGADTQKVATPIIAAFASGSAPAGFTAAQAVRPLGFADPAFLLPNQLPAEDLAKRVDVFVNGQLLLSGSSQKVGSGSADYLIHTPKVAIIEVTKSATASGAGNLVFSCDNNKAGGGFDSNGSLTVAVGNSDSAADIAEKIRNAFRDAAKGNLDNHQAVQAIQAQTRVLLIDRSNLAGFAVNQAAVGFTGGGNGINIIDNADQVSPQLGFDLEVDDVVAVLVR